MHGDFIQVHLDISWRGGEVPSAVLTQRFLATCGETEDFQLLACVSECSVCVCVCAFSKVMCTYSTNSQMQSPVMVKDHVSAEYM